MIAMRDYQEEALAAIEESDAHRQLLALPTGTGKTVVFSELIKRRGGTALILAHRDELLQQAAKKLTTVAPELGMSVGFVQAQRNDTHSPVVVASVQTLARKARLEQLPAKFDTVVVDEAHHAAAESYQRILDHVHDSGLIVGVTATPERGDKATLHPTFEELVYARSIEEMIREGYLADLRAVRVELGGLELDKVKKSRGDFQAEDLGRALEQADVIEHAIAAYTEHAIGRKTIAFFPTVALSISAAAAFNEAGLRAAHIDGTTDKDVRRDVLRAFSAGELDLVSNVGVLTEGYDEPSIECVLIGAPTKSKVKYVQMVGRGTRTHPGKSDCLVLDVCGVTEDHKVQSVGVLFGLQRAPKDNESLTEAADRELEELAEEEEKREARRERDRKRRAYSKTAELFNRDRIHWLRIGERWVLGLKDDYVVIDPLGEENFRVLVVAENKAVVVAGNLDFGYASGVCEQLVRESGAIPLADTEAPWREDPASPGQRRMLGRLNVPPPNGELTKGQAADLITETIARRRLARLDLALERRRLQEEAIPA